MTKRASAIKNNAARLISLVSVFLVFLSIDVYATSIGISTAICEPGSYAFTENGSDCQICPPGTYSDLPGSEFCKLCLDTFYSNEGANSAELLNGNIYCVYLGSMDDDFVNSNSGDMTQPTAAAPPSSIQIAVEFPSMIPSRIPSMIPSRMESSGPSYAPSTMPSKSSNSLIPSKSSTMADVGDVLNDDFESLVICNDQSSETNRFEWYGQCKQCPSKYGMILFPILVLLFLVALIALLEFLIPVCFTAHVWWGVEYLQMLYLIGISSASWSPAAGFFFGRVLPIFAIDFNVSFSLQCVMGKNWPQQEAADQLLVLSLPVILLIAMTFLSKISRNRIIRDESISRWMTVLLNVGYLKLVLSSLEVLKFPTSWSADDLSAWANSDSFYSTLGGLAGLSLYGLLFPFWFLLSIFRYNMFTLALNNADAQEISSVGHQETENNARQQRDLRKKNYTKRKKELFMTLGIFPISLRRNAWWWLGALMLRKFFFAVFWSIFPDGQFMSLVVFLLIFLLSGIVQQYCQPLGDEHCEASVGSKKKWHSIAAVDAVLQLCLAALIGIAIFSSWSVEGDESKRSRLQKRMEDMLLLLIFFTSSVYLTATIGMCCIRPEPRFLIVASQIVIENNNSSNNNDGTSTSTKNNSAIASSSDEISIMRCFSLESSSTNDARKEIDFSSTGEDSTWNRHDIEANLVDKKYVAGSKSQTTDCGSVNSSPYLVGKGDEQEGSSREYHEQGIKAIPTRSRPGIFHNDSSITTNEGGYHNDIEDDTETVYEEIWVDDDTGEEISDPKQGSWMDAETGLVAVPPSSNYDNLDINEDN